MIRQATIEDATWMAEKGLPKFSKIYSQVECPSIDVLKAHFEELIRSENMSFVTDCKSAFIIIKHIFSIDIIAQKIEFWFSEIAGHGILLWDFVCNLAKKHKMPQIEVFHEVERSLEKFLKRRGFNIQDFKSGFKLALKGNI